MTFEEFKKKAGAEPELNCKSIFKVELFFIESWDMNDDGEKIAPYVESTILDLDMPEVYYFFSCEDAKKQILSEQSIHPDSFHSARVTELPIGLPIHDGEYLSITVFDRNTEISFSSRLPTVEGLTDVNGNNVDTTFYGYHEKDMPYHRGEIVEAMDIENQTVSIGIVVKTPMSLEENWKRFGHLDEPIDILNRYKIMTGEVECGYIRTDLIFKPSFPVSDKIRKQLQRWYEAWTHPESIDFTALLEML